MSNTVSFASPFCRSNERSEAGDTEDLDRRTSGFRTLTDEPLTLAGRAAERFLAESAFGWDGHELAAWCHDELFTSGFIALRNPSATTFLVHQPGAGFAQLPTKPGPYPFGDHASNAGRIVDAARGPIIDALRLLTLSQPDDRFAREALYTSRVQRRSSNGHASWTPVLAEGAPLSEWVLSLLAADLLAERERYDDRLFVCDICQSVGFGDGKTRGLCPQHAMEAFRNSARRIRRASDVTAPVVSLFSRSRTTR